MRGIRIVYLVLMTGIVAVAMSGCNRQAMAVMDRADALLDDRPDSAKVLLEQINPDRFLCPGRRARYTVLATTARERTTMDPKVSEEERRDTLLRAALEWYELHPNRRPKDYMRALYYYGYRQHRLKDYSTAIYYLTQAQQWAEKLDNPFYSGMAFREIGSAYLLSFNYAEAIENEKKAIAAFEKAGKPLHAADAKKAMARAYYSSGDFTQAQILYEQVLEVFQDSVFRSHTLVSLAETLIIQSPDNADRAIQLIEESVSLGNALWMDGWGVLAEAYAVKGQFSKADSALKEVERLATSDVRKNNVRYARSRVARAKGDFRTAYDNEEAFRLGGKRLSITGKRESITAVQREYFRMLAKYSQDKLYTQRRNVLLGIMALLVTIIIAGYYIRKSITRYKNQNTQYELALDKEKLSGDTRRNLVLTFSKIISAFNDGRSAVANQKARELFAEFQKGTYTPQLEMLANAANKDAVKRLREACKDKTGWEEEDFQLYALFLTGMTNAAVSAIFRNKKGLELHTNAVYTRKCRLKKKLQEAFPDENFHLYLQD